MKPTLDECKKVIIDLVSGSECSDAEIMQRARLLYFLNRLSFWDDMPILFDLINHEKNKK